jgi:hypothetical protein
MSYTNIAGTLSKELLNKALSYRKKNIDTILKEYPDGLVPTGIKKKGKDVTDYYYNVYSFELEKDYLEWRAWAEEKVEDEGFTKQALDWWECLYGLREDYLPFRKKEGELF